MNLTTLQTAISPEIHVEFCLGFSAYILAPHYGLRLMPLMGGRTGCPVLKIQSRSSSNSQTNCQGRCKWNKRCYHQKQRQQAQNCSGVIWFCDFIEAGTLKRALQEQNHDRPVQHNWIRRIYQ